MKTLTLQVPDSVNEHEVVLQLASVLFERGLMSSGQAAALAGMTKRTFIESVGKYGVSVFAETADDVQRALNG